VSACLPRRVSWVWGRVTCLRRSAGSTSSIAHGITRPPTLLPLVVVFVVGGGRWVVVVGGVMGLGGGRDTFLSTALLLPELRETQGYVRAISGAAIRGEDQELKALDTDT
jgi:hypothetical protein